MNNQLITMFPLLEIAYQVLTSAWHVFLNSSPFVIFGFIVAGLLKGFLPDDMVSKHLGKGESASVLKSALVGIPLPLCSCGVLPTAAGLKEQGADKGAVTSFMIATPETGIDSIAITYALLDPIMTIFRPLAALITAVSTGLLVNLSSREEEKIPSAEVSCCSNTSSCGSGIKETKPTFSGKLTSGMSFAFGDLIDDIGGWLLIGVLLAGMISVFVSPAMIETYVGGGFLSMLFMLAVATPLYVCATASTPIAAALVLKGISPGAALVFLLAGPATNMATITVVAKIIGKKAATIYVLSILLCSLAMGLLVNEVYNYFGLDINSWTSVADSESHGFVAYGSTIILFVFILRGFVKKVGFAVKQRQIKPIA